MPLIVTADLHFTDNPRDAHRWDLLAWLGKQALKYKANAVLLLGDLTDAKDKHSAALTNRMVNGLRLLSDVVPVYILRGNHDYIDEAEPFFGFMDEMSMDRGGRICFLTQPKHEKFAGLGRVLLLPNTRNYEEDWKDLDLHLVRFVFTHQTYDGCLTENGTRLEGIPPSFFARFPGKVISGDIHKPQKVGKNIEYVGAPYRCRFGDDYLPRVLLINDDGTTKDLFFETKEKHLVELSVDAADQVEAALKRARAKQEILAGDQVKVRVILPRASYPDWPAIRAEIVAETKDLELTGPELVAAAPAKTKAADRGNLAAGGQTGPAEALTAYADAKAVPAALKAAGQKFLKAAMT